MSKIINSIELLLEKIKSDYEFNGAVDSFFVFGFYEDSYITYDIENFNFNDKSELIDFGFSGENDSFVFFRYLNRNSNLLFIAKKDPFFHGDGDLGNWKKIVMGLEDVMCFEEINLKKEMSSNNMNIIPGKEEILTEVQNIIKNKDFIKEAVSLMSESSSVIMQRLQQNISCKILEDSDAIITNFIDNLSDTLLSHSINYFKYNLNNYNELPVFPLGTRYIKQDGNILNIVIEQPPQARTIFFEKSATNFFDLLAFNNNDTNANNSVPYYLSFPYTIFVIKFINGQYTGELNVFSRSVPLGSIDDKLYKIPLPNINHNGKVCLGEFNVDSQTIDGKCNEIISGFWQTVFTQDYIEYFCNFLSNNSMSIGTWTKKTKENPFLSMDFIFEEVNINLKDIFHINGTNSNSNIDNFFSLIKSQIAKEVGEIGKEIKKSLMNIDITSENREKIYVNLMAKNIRDIVSLAYSDLWQKINLKLKMERDYEIDSEIVKLKKMKFQFMYWLENVLNAANKNKEIF